jgi:hypothetical protein
MSTVLELVREFRDAGGFYDDDALRFVSDRLQVEPTRELSRECYRAKTELHDIAATAKLEELRAEGFALFCESSPEIGGRYEVRRATLYCGRNVPDYGAAVICRSVFSGGTLVAFLPGRNRTNGFRPSDNDLLRKV